jgi:hypothetical protein
VGLFGVGFGVAQPAKMIATMEISARGRRGRWLRFMLHFNASTVYHNPAALGQVGSPPKARIYACGRGRPRVQQLRSLLSARQAFGQSSKFRSTAVRLPDNPAILEQAEDRAARRAAQGHDAVTRLKRRSFAEAFDDPNHALPVKHASNIVGDSGHHLASATGGKIGENEVNNRPSDIGERVAVEEKEGSPAVALPKELYGFAEGEGFALFLEPLCFSRSVAL